MSNAAAGFAPTRSATIAATEGVCLGLLTVAMITASICRGSTPDAAIASLAASVARSIAEVVGIARVRVTMPVR